MVWLPQDERDDCNSCIGKERDAQAQEEPCRPPGLLARPHLVDFPNSNSLAGDRDTLETFSANQSSQLMQRAIAETVFYGEVVAPRTLFRWWLGAVAAESGHVIRCAQHPSSYS